MKKQLTFELPKTKYMKKTSILNTILIAALIAAFFGGFYVYTHPVRMRASEAVNLQLVDQSLNIGK